MDWAVLANGLDARSSSLTNQSNDPRLGSSRDNATGGTLSHTTNDNSSSAASLGSTFVPVLVYAAVCLAIFVFFRRTSPRVYAPRTIPDINRFPWRPIPPLPSGWVNWIKPFYQIDERFILHNCSLDGFFFLRYVRILATICATGCVIAWPVLLTVNATGGNKLTQLDLLTIGDVANPTKFYAHVFISWLFFGFVLFMICRECIFYINLRQAYLMVPQNAHRLSARTVLITCVPKHFLDEHRIRKLYGDAVKNVWIPRNTRALDRLVKERDKAAERLETAQIELIKKANFAWQRKQGNCPSPFSLKEVISLPRPFRSNSGASKASEASKVSDVSKASDASHALDAYEASLTSPSSSRPSSLPSSSSFSSGPSRSSSGPAAHPSVHAPGLIDETIDAHGSTDDLVGKGTLQVQVVGATDQSEAAPVRPGPSPIAWPLPTASDAVDEPAAEAAGTDVEKEVVITKEKDDEDDKDDKDDKDDDDDAEENYVHPYGFDATLPDVRGSVAAQWLPTKERPTHRPVANFGRKVDTIRWATMRLKSLNHSIARMRRRIRNGDGDVISAVFVEFDSQAAAQVAFQVLSHHQPLHMSPRYIGIRPEDVIWSSLRIRWWERIIRRFAVMGAVAASIIFWSIPSAFVGIISNISFLSNNVFFLHWIAKLPGSITGVIQGLLPALALSLLMSAVPGLMRALGRTAGIPSKTLVELFSQNAYFGFQIVQVFLVTTLTSAASSAFTQILKDPLSAKDILSKNLPKASNFYLSYITVQCLAGGAMGMVHFLDLFRHKLLAKGIKSPRRAVRIWHKMKRPHWGGIYPVFTNMGVIAISYTCIAPLILVFAAIGMCVTYQVYKYNLVYTFDTDRDSKGLHYPRGLMHLMAGLYLAEICLIGLFSIQAAIGPVVMMVLFFIFTGLVHLSLRDAVGPLLYSLPRTLALEDKDLAAGHQDRLAEERAAAAGADDDLEHSNRVGLAADYYDMEEGYGDESEEDEEPHTGPVTARGVDGAGDLMFMLQNWGRDTIKSKVKNEVKAVAAEARSFSFQSYVPTWAKRSVSQGSSGADDSRGAALGPDGQPDAAAGGAAEAKPNFFVRWMHPEIYEDYTFLRKTLMPEDATPVEYPPDYAQRGYWPSEMWRPMPRVWLPRDQAHVSRQEVAFARKVVPATDVGMWLTAKGRVEADLCKAPFIEPRFLH